MPLVQISLFPGRSAEKKAEMAREITRVLETVGGIRPADTTVIFTEVSPADWSVGGEPLGGGAGT